MHLLKRELLVLALFCLQAVEGFQHLWIFFLLLIKAQQHIERIGIVVILSEDAFISFDSLVVLLIGNIILCHPLAKGKIGWSQGDGTRQTVLSQGVLLHLLIVHRLIEIHLSSTWIDLAGMLKKLECIAVTTQSLKTGRLLKEVVVTLAVIARQTIGSLHGHSCQECHKAYEAQEYLSQNIDSIHNRLIECIYIYFTPV